MEIRGAECGKEKSDVQAGRKKRVIVAAIAIRQSFWKNKCKVEKPWKRNAFVAAAGKLYLLIRFTFLLG
ncbi:hypothetical protein T01_8429 [Trichinella spiralis]|uniref:Uncharacterized protein n=1 Tax=Trichinella spiralis TaxID=6334 RepID=A0A0V1BCW8_TRISP|nr:hypothetical protein T01_8429 [Trichinella spiralis]